MTPSADLGDLREAFRRLAKRHHPDRARYSRESEAGDARMKEINIAFNLLKQELKPARQEETAYTEQNGPSDESGHSVFSFVRNWRKTFSRKRQNNPDCSEKKERPVSGGACANRPRRRASGRRKRSFRHEFHKSFRETAANESGTPGRGRHCRNRTVYNYSTYMKLKKKMSSPARRRNSDPGPIGPVSRISRIKRVEK